MSPRGVAQGVQAYTALFDRLGRLCMHDEVQLSCVLHVIIRSALCKRVMKVVPAY